jgi:acetyltransferase-like isoleucine patch superfamily enzyme
MSRKGDVVHRIWQWATVNGAVGPSDKRGKRFQLMGPGSLIAFPPGAVFGERLIRIGAGTMIGPHVSLAAGMHPDEPLQVPGGVVITIGDRCMIGRGNSIIGRCSIEIGDDVTTAPNVYITDHNHSYGDVTIPVGRQWPIEDPVRIGAGCWLGTGVVVLPGADIGKNVTVAAGSVVRGTIPDFSVIAGAPAKVVRQHTDADGWTPPLRRPASTPDWWIV